jgi:hypothetical protein
MVFPRRVGQPAVEIIAKSLSKHDEKNVVPTPFSEISVGE